MSNDVKIRVTMTDDTAATRAKIIADARASGAAAAAAMREELTKGAQAGGEDTGTTYWKSFSGSIDEEAPKAADESWKSFSGSLENDVKKTGQDAGGNFWKSFSGGLGGGSDVGGQLGDSLAQGAKKAGKDAGDALGSGLEEGAKKAGEDAGDAMGKGLGESAKKRVKENQTDLTSALWLSLVPAAPLVGAAAGAALAGGLALGLSGGVAAVAATNNQVKQQFSALTGDLKQNAHEWGDAVAVPVSQALNRVQSAFDALAPSIDTALVNTSQDFGILVGAATDFAANVMPGVVASSARLQPVFVGLRELAAGLGTELGSDFDQVSQHSAQAGTTLSSVGTIVDSLLHGVTALATQGLDVYAQHSQQVEAGVHSLVSALTGLTSGALPALGTAFGGEVTMITGFLNALQPIGPELGAVGGFALSAYTNAKLLGTLSGPISGAASALKGFGTAGTFVGDLTTKVGSGLEKVGGALPAVGIGFTALGTIFDMVAQHERDLTQAGNDVGTALAKGGAGAVAASQQIAQWRAEITRAQADNASLSGAITATTAAASRFGLQQSNNTATQASNNQAIADNQSKIQAALDSYNAYTAGLGATAATIDQLTGKTAIYSGSAQSAASNTSELNAATQILNSAASTAQQRIQALQTVLAGLSDNGLQKAQDYAAQFGQAVDSFSQQITTAKGSVFGLNGELDTNSEKGREVLQVLEQSQQAWVGQAQSMASAGQSADQVSAALQGNQNQLVGVLTQAGLTKDQIQQLINTYGLIPANITTKVNADTSPAMGAVGNLVRYINGIRTMVTVDAVTGATTSLRPVGGGRTASAHGGVLGAASGMVLPGGLRLVGEQGAEIIRESAGSSVIPRSGVDRAITDALGGRGAAAAPSGVTFNFAGNTDSAFARLFMTLLRSGQIRIDPAYVGK